MESYSDLHFALLGTRIAPQKAKAVFWEHLKSVENLKQKCGHG